MKIQREDTRLIDRWFPVAAVDESCGNTSGSGKIEKAIFPWFASRPIAQARAASLTALLPDRVDLKYPIERAIRTADKDLLASLAKSVITHYGRPPIVLDMFSGRAMIPLEAARAGAISIGIDLSPVATFGGRLLASYASIDASQESRLPFDKTSPEEIALRASSDRLVNDVELTLLEIGARVSHRLQAYYPRNKLGRQPWGYMWAITVPCDGCKRRFPVIGTLVLRHPYKKTSDLGQSIKINTAGNKWTIEVIDGAPVHQPTYQSGFKADGKKKKGKTARCPFCRHVHSLEAVKAKGAANEYEDELLLTADIDENDKRYYRLPTVEEQSAVVAAKSAIIDKAGPFSGIPDEQIPSGNVHTVMASGYGFRKFGQLMCLRQTLAFATTASTIREIAAELIDAGVSEEYVRVIAGYSAAAFCRRLKFSTRGVGIQCFGSPDGAANNNISPNHVFSSQAVLKFQFDWFETGTGLGPGTWQSVSESTVKALAKIRNESRGKPARIMLGSATALPLRDASVDVVITDPPYYDMIEYADVSDFMYVWLRRILFDLESDLFGEDATQQPDGLQDKNQEIIVRRVHEPNRVKHDTQFYESMLAKSFGEARRVLKESGHLVVMFGHSDPDAWRRLLGALQTAGFIVTSAWPSRTESANTGVASIKVTVTIGCRVAPEDRPVGMGSEVDREVVASVVERVGQWQNDGLALEDQLMASYGPAMEVYGRYQSVLNPDGTVSDLDHYLALARRTVRDAMRLKIDQLPLETFDAITRFAIFWLRAKKHDEVVPKGEARFFAQADELRLDDLRGRILTESKAGFQLNLRDEREATEQSSVFEVVRSMAYAWDQGGLEAVAKTIALAGLHPANPHLWAVVSDLASHLPASDTTAKALAGMQRSASTIDTVVAGLQTGARQRELFDSVEV